MEADLICSFTEAASRALDHAWRCFRQQSGTPSSPLFSGCLMLSVCRAGAWRAGTVLSGRLPAPLPTLSSRRGRSLTSSSLGCPDAWTPQNTLTRAGFSGLGGTCASHCSGFSRCGARALDMQASAGVVHRLVAPQHVGSSQTRDQTPIPCTGSWILSHCTTREVSRLSLNPCSFEVSFKKQ